MSPPPADYCLLGMPVHALSMDEAVACVLAAIARRERLFISTPNINYAAAGCRDHAFRRALIDSDLVLADGMPLVWLARWLGLPIAERVAGATLFECLRRGSRDAGPVKVYFFGGPAGAAARAAQTLNAERRGVVCVGYATPGYSTVEVLSEPHWIDAINASGADFLVVALGAVKGQAWLQRNRARLQTPVIAHLGAVVNFVAGTVPRAPRVLQRSGLEWAWRIAQEPQLWRRYLADAGTVSALLAAEVLPGRLARQQPAAPQWAGARAFCAGANGATVMTLAGAWGEPNRPRLRPVIDAARAAPGVLRVDCRALTALDAGACAELLRLLRRPQAPLFDAVPVAVRRLFAAHGAGYVLDRPALAEPGVAAV